MSKVLGILTAIVLASAAFVAYKNKAAHEREIIAEVEAKDALAKAQAKLSESKGKLANIESEHAAAPAKGAEMIQMEEALKTEAADLNTQTEAKTAKVASNKAKLDEIREKTSKLGNVKELATKLMATNQELEALNQQISSAEATLAGSASRVASVEKAVESTKKNLESFASQQSAANLQTRIRSVYPEWGFVTLAGGNSVGIVGNSTLNVIRDGQLIAQLLVTAVERNTATASVVPGSLAQDTRLRAGDQVTRGEKAAPKPAASGVKG